MSQLLVHKPRKSRSLSRFCNDVSAVLNRVRIAFGSLSMKAVANRPEVKAAEVTIERAARLVRGGEEGLDVWQGALIVYEATWMAVLRELQRSGKSAA